MKIVFYFFNTLLLGSLLLFSGCMPQQEPSAPAEPFGRTATIGSVSQYYAPLSIRVRGIGIVAGLQGTGSSECPADIRQELEKYIWQQSGAVSPRSFIESQDTAVVEISGIIPAFASASEVFDVQLRPLSSTQTTSLDGGHLYTSELKETSRLSSVEQFTHFTKTLAVAEGPAYSLTETSGTQGDWFVLGGGRAVQNSVVKLILDTPGFITANAIRNRVNERFGPKTAIAVSEAEITISFPAEFQEQKQRFLRILETLLLADNPQIRDEHTQFLIDQLLSKTDSDVAELGLEGIGKPALDHLAPLLEHDDPETRFQAARCMLNIGDSRPLAYLRNIIQTPGNPNRIEAIQTVGFNAKRKDAFSILNSALDDSDLQVRLQAYKMLVRLNSPAISRKVIANRSFVVDNVVCSGPKMVYVYQSKSPRIVIFGSPVYCKDNLFIQSDDGSVTLNAKSGDKYIAVSRRHPSRPRVIGPLSSSYELSNLIQILGELPEIAPGSTSRRPGLAIPYAQIVGLLENMAAQGAIQAQYIKGPAPEPVQVLQTLPSN